MKTKLLLGMIYLRYVALVFVGVVCAFELYAIIHLFMYPEEYRFGTEVAGAGFSTRERYLGYRTLTLALAAASIGTGLFYRDRWWPLLLLLTMVAFALL